MSLEIIKDAKFNVGDYVSMLGLVYEVTERKFLDYVSEFTYSDGWHYHLKGYSDIMMPGTHLNEFPNEYISQLKEVTSSSNSKPIHFSTEKPTLDNPNIIKGNTCYWLEDKKKTIVYQYPKQLDLFN